uniref:uncharacterized protein LOC122609106 n=1 Tax=Erigeron canadensis TaxID=72917 RepID=UPI001CB9CEF6|nr:uncharacterized protein LOC122609106 [Erigeron canadensis]
MRYHPEAFRSPDWNASKFRTNPCRVFCFGLSSTHRRDTTVRGPDLPCAPRLYSLRAHGPRSTRAFRAGPARSYGTKLSYTVGFWIRRHEWSGRFTTYFPTIWHPTHRRGLRKSSDRAATVPSVLSTATYRSPLRTRTLRTTELGALMYQNALELQMVGGSVENSPFIAWIQNYPLPKDLKYPSHLGTYKGKSDPDDFIEAVEGVAEMKVWNVPVACRMFRYALEGDAREWLKSVAKGSITSFEDLKEKFRARLSQQKKHKKLHVAAHGVKQRETEPCRAFLDRGLVEFLYRDLPKTYEAVQKRGHVYLDARDTALKPDISPTQDKETQTNRKGKWNNDRERPRYDPYNKDEKGYLKVNLPELHKSPKEILLTESVAKTFPTPPRLSGKNRKDPKKYCEFHRDYGHDTNACWQLRKTIEEAINEGKLSHLVKSVRQQQHPKKEDDTDDKKKVPDKTIYTIVKKKIGYSSRRPKRGNVPSITFLPIYNGRIFRDPLIISAFLEVSKVKEIVVDTGSECNVLYEEVFWKLNPLSRMNFRKAGASIQGYSGDTAEPLGKLSMQTMIGKGHWKRKEKITFMVVSGTSPFQAILGRPEIQKFGMIPSIMHGLIKYETNGRIATLEGKAKKLSNEG